MRPPSGRGGHDADVEALWADFARPIATADDYLASLRGRRDERVLHGRARAGAGRSSGDPALDQRDGRNLPARHRAARACQRPAPRSAAARSTASCMCRLSPSDLVAKHEMQRELGRRTGTCFQRCVGLDAIGACHSVTFDIDAERGTDYHKRFLAFLRRAQIANIVIGGAMTDPKGDRSQAAAPAGRSRPVPARRAPRRQRHLRVRREDAPDRRGQLALADLHADHALDRGRQRLGGGRRGAGRRAGAHLHRRPPDQRHPGRGRRRARRRQRAVRRPGIADRVRRRVRALRARLHGRRMGLRRDAGRAVHHLSPLVLRLQDRAGRRADRRRGRRRRATTASRPRRTSRTSSSR